VTKSHREVVVPVPPQPVIRAVSLADFIQRRRRDYLIKTVLPRRGLALTYGEATSGKTFFVLDLALAVAEGIPWRGHRVTQAGVLWICSEGLDGFGDRLRAYLTHYALEGEAIPFEVIDTPVDLLDGTKHVELLIDATKDTSERVGTVGLIVVDTLNRVLVGGDENRPEDMSAFVANVSCLSEATGTLVNVIHHAGKDLTRGARGHSSLRGGVDTEIAIAGADDGERVATITKARDGISGTRFGFALQVVDLGLDKDNDPITSCVVVPAEVPASKPKQRPASGVAKAALQALGEALKTHGETMPETSTIPRGVQVVLIERWRVQFAIWYGSDGERKADTIGKAFRRAKDELLKREQIQMSEPYVWRT
jgi:hypothetical protein